MDNTKARMRFIFILALVSGVVMTGIATSEAEAPAAVRLVDQGLDMWDTQNRLALTGLYEGKVTGINTEQTTEAIKAFQRLNGITPTGKLDLLTESQLKMADLNKEQLDLMARLVFAEGRGEPFEGQVAIAAVVLNRIASDQFPDTLDGVIYASGAFSAVQKNTLPGTSDETARTAVQEALAGRDPSNGSLYFFNPQTATSSWIWTRPHTVRIGKHLFAR